MPTIYLILTRDGKLIGPCHAGCVLALGRLGRLEPGAHYKASGREEWLPIEEFYSSSGLDFNLRGARPRGLLELFGLLLLGGIMMAILGPVRLLLPNPFIVFPVWFALCKFCELVLRRPVWTMIFAYTGLVMRKKPRVNLAESLDLVFLTAAIAVGLWRFREMFFA